MLLRKAFAKRVGIALIRGMKAFVAFVLVLFLLIGAGGGYFVWTKMQRVEEWGVRLNLGSELSDTEKKTVQKRYNAILDQEELLRNTVEQHNLKDYYGVSSSDEAVAMLKEDTFVQIYQNKSIDVLFRGKRISRKEREAAIRTLSEEFYNKVQSYTGGP